MEIAKTEFYLRLEESLKAMNVLFDQHEYYRHKVQPFLRAEDVPARASTAVVEDVARVTYNIYRHHRDAKKINEMPPAKLEQYLQDCYDDKRRNCELHERAEVFPPEARKGKDTTFRHFPSSRSKGCPTSST